MFDLMATVLVSLAYSMCCCVEAICCFNLQPPCYRTLYGQNAVIHCGEKCFGAEGNSSSCGCQVCALYMQMSIGLLYVTASVYQMLRGAEMLFAAFFSVTVLKR